MSFVNKIRDGFWTVTAIGWRMQDGEWRLVMWNAGHRKSARTAFKLALRTSEPLFVDPCNA